MNELDAKINKHFPGLVVRKDLVKLVKGNAIVPTYVLEYLLGQYCATSDTDTIESGIHTVKEILRKHYVNRNEAGLVRSTIKERGRHKIIDKVSVSLNDKSDCYEARFANLGVKKVVVDADTVKRHPKLLVSGVWCIVDMEYSFSENKDASPWLMSSLKPIQLSHFDFKQYIYKRNAFSVNEWIDILIQSIGFNPQMFSRRSKLIQLCRLIPYCERNYNMIELGPKGTGKSHIYSEFSPHGILISGGEVTIPKLFVNNSTGKIGLVGYWDTVAFDEFAGKKKRVNKALVDIMKNFMANKNFSRGVETLGAEASMVFVGNTQHTLPYMLKHSNLFDELPEMYYDSAFLDRLHMYIPGWEVGIIRGEMFSDGYGFVVDYLAEILKTMRSHDYSLNYTKYLELYSDISTRDRDGIHKTFSGLMKILFPSGEASDEDVEELLHFAIEGRKRVKEQLMRIDTTYEDVCFGYTTSHGKKVDVHTLEEIQYPQYYSPADEHSDETSETKQNDIQVDDFKYIEEPQGYTALTSKFNKQHIVIEENQTGVSFEGLFAKYFKGASTISITDPYIRKFYQIKNLLELLDVVIKYKKPEDEVTVNLVTIPDEFNRIKQEEHLNSIAASMPAAGIRFNWHFSTSNTIHARYIIVDEAWKISLDRGLDIFQRYDYNDAFSLENRLQTSRPCLAFEVTFLRMD